MTRNFGYLTAPVAVAKGFTVILGLISVVLGWHAYYCSFFNIVVRYDDLWYIESLIEEQIFIYTTLILLITSIVCLIFNAASDASNQSQAVRMADFVFHLMGTVALLIIGSLMIYSTVDIDCNKCLHLESYLAAERVLGWVAGVPCQLYEEKMAAGVIALLNGILYGVAGIMVITASPYY